MASRVRESSGGSGAPSVVYILFSTQITTHTNYYTSRLPLDVRLVLLHACYSGDENV